MPFPMKDRVVFEFNPLDEVICQLKFPSILRIDVDLPVDYQEYVSKEYPVFKETSSFVLDNINESNKSLIGAIVGPSKGINYQFESIDGIWIINLTKDFIALRTTRYERWEVFRKKLLFAINGFLDIYKPNYCTRMGLRYIDMINRKSIGLDGCEWHELLNPALIGGLADSDIFGNVRGFESKQEIALDDDKSFVRIISALINTIKYDDLSFLIDSDIFCERTLDFDAAIDRLDYFNSVSSKIIQWGIKRKLFDALHPIDVEKI